MNFYFNFNFGEERNRCLNFGVGPIKHKGEKDMALNITINDEQKVNVTLNPVDAEGKAAALVGVPVWTVTSGDATLDIAADGLSAFIISGAIGNSVITVVGQGDPTPGVDVVSGEIDLTVTAAEATDLGLTAAPPVLK